MDITYHVILLVIICILFFLNNYAKGYNSLLFIIVLCGVGLVVITQSDTYIDVGELHNYTYVGLPAQNDTRIDTITITPLQEPLNYNWFLIVMYLISILLAILNITVGDKYIKNER